MPEFGIFEDGELIVPGFVNEESAEQYVDQMKCLPIAGAGAYDVRQMCPRHGDHGVDDCPGEGPWSDGPAVLERLRDALTQ